MSEDLRGYQLLLVSHHVLNHTTLEARPGVQLSASVVDWAHEQGYGVYQLPAPGYYFESETERAADVARTRSEDRAALDFVASQLRVYLDNGYSVVGAVVLAEDAAEPREHAWREDLVGALAAIDVVDLPLWSVSRDEVEAFAPIVPISG